MNDDLIRRSELLAELERLEAVCECPGIDFSELRKVIARITPVRPGAIADAMVVENPNWKLYTEMRNGEPVGYRYGPDWVAMELYVEGGFKTPEEAKLRWLEWWEAHGK